MGVSTKSTNFKNSTKKVLYNIFSMILLEHEWSKLSFKSITIFDNSYFEIQICKLAWIEGFLDDLVPQSRIFATICSFLTGGLTVQMFILFEIIDRSGWFFYQCSQKLMFQQTMKIEWFWLQILNKIGEFR